MRKLLVLGLVGALLVTTLFSGQSTAEKTTKMMLVDVPVEVNCSFIHNKTTLTIKSLGDVTGVVLTYSGREVPIGDLLQGWSVVYVVDGLIQSGKVVYSYKNSHFEKPFYCS